MWCISCNVTNISEKVTGKQANELEENKLVSKDESHPQELKNHFVPAGFILAPAVTVNPSQN